MVKETYDSITAVKPSLVFSAAVWGVYEDKWNWKTQSGLNDLMQDARAWARDSYMDVLVPMNYYRIQPVLCARADWTCLLLDHLRATGRGTGRQMYIGMDAGKGVREIVNQIRVARRNGASGFALFSFGEADRAGMWPILAATVFSDRAAVPLMPWKLARADSSAVGSTH